MPPRRFALGCALLVAATLLLVGQGLSFSGGNSPAAREGCGPGAGCHGVPGVPSAIVVATLEGVPEAYAAGATYEVTVGMEGGPPVTPLSLNHGGFALAASAGTLLPVDDAAQSDGLNATHTEGGNDQRTWSLRWIAPDPGQDEVTFWLSVNAVNGNAVQDPADQWNQLQLTSAPGGPSPDQAPVPIGPQGTPGFEAAAALLAVLVVAAGRRAP